MFKERFRLSWREAVEIAAGVRIPDHSTFFYRVQHLSLERLEQFNEWLAFQVLAGRRVELLLFDGTGFGCNAPYYARFARGAEVRRLRSHVKAVLVMGLVGHSRVLIGASLGGAYSDERRLAVDWLREGGGLDLGSGLYVVRDKLYGRVGVSPF